MKGRRLKILVFVLLLIFYGSLLTYKIQLPNAEDMGRHIKNGELIVHGHFDILYKNVYSFTQPEYPAVNHHWLSGVVYYLLFQVIGWSGLVVFKIIVLLLAFALLFKVALKKADFWVVAFFSIPAIFILVERGGLRPENFSYLFVAVFLYLLSDLEEHPESKKIFWLIPLQLLWVNMHIFFFIGVALTAGFLLEKFVLNRKSVKGKTVIKKLTFLLMALIVACFMNPSTVAGALYPFNIFHNYGVDVSENVKLYEVFRTGTYWGDYSVALYTPIVVFLGLSFVLAFKQKQKPIFYFMASVGAALAGFMLIRALALFGLMFLPAVSENFNALFVKTKNKIKDEIPRIGVMLGKVLIVFLIVVISSLTFFLGQTTISARGVGLAYRSLDSIKFFKEQNLKGPIFNDYDIGSYLVYGLYPEEKVWVDNRPEAYSAKFFKEVSFPMIADEDIWKEMSEKYKINVIFFYQYDQGSHIRDFFWRRVHDPQWFLVYVDIYNIIFVKNVPQNSDIITKFAITSQTAEKRLAYLMNSENPDDQITAADTLNLIGLEDLGTRMFLDVLSKYPNKAKLWMILGEWELGKNDPRSPLLAAMFLDKAISLGWKTAEAYSFLGAAYAKLNRIDNARDALLRALKINPERQDAQELLSNIEKLKNQ